MSSLYISPRLTIPARDLCVTTARSSGPGGQNVNKVNSKVTLRWNIDACEVIDQAWRQRFRTRYATRINKEGEVIIHSERYRDQVRNLADARHKLMTWLLECQTAPKKRRPTKPSRGSQRRRLESKKRQSDKKQSRRGSWDG